MPVTGPGLRLALFVLVASFAAAVVTSNHAREGGACCGAHPPVVFSLQGADGGEGPYRYTLAAFWPPELTPGDLVVELDGGPVAYGLAPPGEPAWRAIRAGQTLTADAAFRAGDGVMVHVPSGHATGFTITADRGDSERFVVAALDLPR